MGWSGSGANNSPAPLHNLGEEVDANITSGALDNFFDAALPGEFLVVL